MYAWMALAVLVSAGVAYYAGSVMKVTPTGGMSWILLIAWFILPFILGRAAMRNAVVGFIELMVYAALTGLMFSSIFIAYTGTTITTAFVSSASIFVAMSAVGLFTKRSLAKLGTQLFGAMIGLIVAMLVNLFLKSGMIELFLSLAAVVIFSLLTMFDTRQMKALYINFHDRISMNGLAINGALALYLDFINIFISLLEIFGGVGNNRN
ncbi:Bax inhibitor-1/YccA family protein [uncultured bacterium]|uniref:Bax inhibitor-1/YccA family protein n=2 Tax=Acetilactobacillus jinshanensis TaxID=1720083 RepID=A0A4V1ALW6_9LACO|nr:Bax inhibitor-1/YccA family protein [Acetilactobacillus jinshanensis]URL61931.1 Bax inhibitor-1/YccA family protein [uncultured bacterium]